jgi:hypothetical protein
VVTLKIELTKSWTKKLAGRIEKYQFEVGVLQDKPHRNAQENTLAQYAGGPIRKTGKGSEKSVAEVLVENMKRLNINILQRPFQEKTSEIMKFTQAFLKFAASAKKGVSTKRIENLLQAIVRNPILKQEYGGNKSITADTKGFDRHLIDTGQMFRAIKVRTKRV